MIFYMFQCHFPNHPTLALSHRVQKTILYMYVSPAVSHKMMPVIAATWTGPEIVTVSEVRQRKTNII